MKRFNKRLIWNNTFLSFLYFVFLVSFIMMGFLADPQVANNEKIVTSLLVIGGVLVICFLSYLYCYYFYKTSGYNLDKNHIECKRGVIFKKYSKLEYERIHSVNKRQNIIQKLFKIATLYVDSGSTNTAHEGEILIIEDSKEIERLIRLINARKEHKEDLVNEEISDIEVNYNDDVCYKVSCKSIFIYSLVVSIFTFIVAFMFIFTISLCFFVSAKTINSNEFMLIEVINLSFGIPIVAFIMAYLVSCVSLFLRYYKFIVRKQGDKINVEYGFFVRNLNSFEISKIKAIRVKQNIIEKIFKLACINVDVVGFVDIDSSNNSSSYTSGKLAPFININKINEVIDSIDSSYIYKEENEMKAIKLLPFISYVSLFTQICLLVLGVSIYVVIKDFAVIYSCLIIMGVIELIIVLLSLLEKKNQGLIINDDKIVLKRGNLVKEIGIIKKDNLVAIDSYTTKFRNKYNIKSVCFYYYSNVLINRFKVSNIVIKNIKDIEKIINY